MKKNKLISLITNLIKKTIGSKRHFLHEPKFSNKEILYTSRTIRENFVSSAGKYVNEFENKIKNFTKAKYAIAVASGTQALFISLKTCGVQKNDEVLVPALTFVATANVVCYLHAKPHFIDSNISDFGVDCKKLDKYLSKICFIKNNRCFNKITGNIIKAIIPVHVFGHPCRIDEVIKLSKKFKLQVIEDATEALGSFYKKKHLGTYGKTGCLSFNGNKIITTGAGGMVLTNDKYLAYKIKHLTTTAKLKDEWEYVHDEIGYNFRMPNLNAALGLAQLEKIKEFVKAKRKLYRKYFNSFKNLKNVHLFEEPKYAVSNYWLQTLILDKKSARLKNKILKDLHANSIYCRPAWKLLVFLKPYKQYQKMDLSGSIEIYKRAVNIPSSQSLILK